MTNNKTKIALGTGASRGLGKNTVASQVGFSSQSHLTQQFKRFAGMTPKQVR